MAGLVIAGANVPGLGLIHSISKQMLCAVSLSGSCGGEDSLELAYGESAAAMVRDHVPNLRYGPDMLGLPVDFRTCRSAYCAEGPDQGMVTESDAGEPVTLFTRVVDCREGSVRLDVLADCDGDRDRNLYVQYWAYYPESASLRGAPLLEKKGFHRHDWESVQVRIDPYGGVDQRASSHGGHNYARSSVNWGSDMGSGPLNWLAEEFGGRPPGGWGEETGEYLIAGGSHAGNVKATDSTGSYYGKTPADRVRLVPLESIRDDELSRAASFDPITPPWEKKLWLDPEEEGTG
jgi:hypothetical protein